VDKKGDMRTLLEKVRYALYRLPPFLLPKGFKRNVHDNFMRITNPETGASITGESNNPNFSTGGRYAGILFDEFAKWESSDESAWTAAGDASPCRIPVSTPFGAGGMYYKLMTEGKIRKTTIHWTQHPEKSLGLYCVWPPPNVKDKDSGKLHGWEPEVELRSPWYDKECERRTPTEIAQELDIDYLGAGNPVFDGKSGMALKYYRKLKVEPRAYVNVLSGESVPRPRDTEGYLLVYKEWEKGSEYVLGVDVVEGKIDGDFCVVKVYNRETKNVDATYHSQVDEVELAFVIQKVASMYSDEEAREFPWVGIETNGPGLATFDKCLDLGVPNLFMMPKYETTKNMVTYRKGWVTNTGSRNMLISGIREYLVGRVGFIDPRCVGELGTFIRNKTGKAEAKAGCYDDEVLCFGICIQVDEIAPYGGKKEKDMVRETEVASPRDKFFRVEEAEGEPRTIEERCFATAAAKQAEKIRVQEEMFEDSLDLLEI